MYPANPHELGEEWLSKVYKHDAPALINIPHGWASIVLGLHLETKTWCIHVHAIYTFLHKPSKCAAPQVICRATNKQLEDAQEGATGQTSCQPQNESILGAVLSQGNALNQLLAKFVPQSNHFIDTASSPTAGPSQLDLPPKKPMPAELPLQMDAGDASTVHQEAGLVCGFPSSKTNLGFIFNDILHAQHLFGQDSQKEASQLDQFEKLSLHWLRPRQKLLPKARPKPSQNPRPRPSLLPSLSRS